MLLQGKRDALRSKKDVQKVTIASYEMLKRLSCKVCRTRSSIARSHQAKCEGLGNCIGALGFGMVIVDESHKLRTTGRKHDSANTEACVSVIKRTKRSILLTGTPSLSKPLDMFRQVNLVVHKLDTYRWVGQRKTQHCSSKGFWRLCICHLCM